VELEYVRRVKKHLDQPHNGDKPTQELEDSKESKNWLKEIKKGSRNHDVLVYFIS
jgi:hypothetical protein